MVTFEKDGNSYDTPDDLKYGKSHVWAKVEGDEITIGVTDYGQKMMKEIVLVDFINGEGDAVTGTPGEDGEPFASLESTKAVAEIFSPATGTVSATNSALEDDPTLVNSDCYGNGWFTKVKGSLADGLLDANAYVEFAKSG